MGKPVASPFVNGMKRIEMGYLEASISHVQTYDGNKPDFPILCSTYVGTVVPVAYVVEKGPTTNSSISRWQSGEHYPAAIARRAVARLLLEYMGERVTALKEELRENKDKRKTKKSIDHLVR